MSTLEEDDSKGKGKVLQNDDVNVNNNNNGYDDTSSSFLSAVCQNLSLVDEQTPFHLEQEVAARNMKRQQEMMEIRAKLAAYEKKLDQLEKEHSKATLLTTLSGSPHVWRILSHDQKYDKQVILLLLRSSYSDLNEEAWNQPEAFPKELLADKDVFRARIKHRNFATYYSTSKKHSLLGNASIPEELLSDKEVLLDLIEVFPKFFLLLRKHKQRMFMSLLMNDKDVFDAILKHHASTATKYLRQFSIRFRTDPEMMVQAIVAMCTGTKSGSTTDVTTCTSSRGKSATSSSPSSFVGRKLVHDKSFCLRVAEAVLTVFAVPDGATTTDDSYAVRQQRQRRRSCPLSLLDLPEHLRADKDVVVAFCRIKGGNVQHAAVKCDAGSDDIDAIVKVACEEDPFSIVLAPPKYKAQSQLLMSKDFILNQALAKLEDEDEVFIFFEILPLKMKQDREIAVAAASKSIAVFTHIKNDWKKDREFWLRLVQKGSGCWCCVPLEMRGNRDFALAFARHGLSGLAAVLLEFPSLLDDRDVIRRMVTVLTPSAWEDIFDVLGPPHMVDDKNFCLALLKIDGRFYAHVHASLREDRDIVKTALGLDEDEDNEADCYPDQVIRLLPHDVMHMYPELIAEAIENCVYFDEDSEEDYDFPNFICHHLWANREIALAWIANGGWWIDQFPDDFSHDKEIFLAFAENMVCPSDCFEYCSQTLKSDKDFMLQAIKHQGCLLHEASEELQDDYDLLLAAYASDRSLIPKLDHDDPDESESLLNFAKKVRKQLEAHTSFMALLCGIAFANNSSTCYLPLLNQGNETALAYKKLIANYVGLPSGDVLRDLRQVSVDLTRWGY